MFTSRYGWNTAKVGVKHQSINQSNQHKLLDWRKNQHKSPIGGHNTNQNNISFEGSNSTNVYKILVLEKKNYIYIYIYISYCNLEVGFLTMKFQDGKVCTSKQSPWKRIKIYSIIWRCVVLIINHWNTKLFSVNLFLCYN